MHKFLTIWKNPRAVMRDILDAPSILLPIIILYFGSVGASMLTLFDSEGTDFTSEFSTDLPLETFNMPIWISILGILVISPIFYFISNTIYSFFTMLFGKWLFKGTGKFKDLFKVNSTAYFPFILGIPVFGIWLLVNPDSFLIADNNSIVGLLFLIFFMLFTCVYFFIFNIIGVAEAHQITKWQAFFTILIPFIIFIILIFLVFIALALVLFIIFTSLAGI